MEINEQSVAAYKAIITNPSNYGLKGRAIQDCFKPSKDVTAKHTLAKQYIDNEFPNLPKLLCYIIMDDFFGLCNGKDHEGYLGYHLLFEPAPQL